MKRLGMWTLLVGATIAGGCFTGVPCKTSADCQAGNGACDQTLGICVHAGTGDVGGGGDGQGNDGGRSDGGSARADGGISDGGGASADGGGGVFDGGAASVDGGVWDGGAAGADGGVLDGGEAQNDGGNCLSFPGTCTASGWAWMSGGNVSDQKGVYGTKGAAAADNVPGARFGALSWTDGRSNLWLFGGFGGDSIWDTGYLNDLWRFDGATWTWVSGDEFQGQPGSYGMKGTAAAGNVPGARTHATSWTDGNGNLWLFGGLGYDSTGILGDLNDLWKFDGTTWTWVSGSDVLGQASVYGTMGLAAAGNVPGSRTEAVSWADGSGNLWLFGGASVYPDGGATGFHNDLWRFDGTNWAWVKGSNVDYQKGVYGTKGRAVATNVPGARYGAESWTDGSGNFWLYGGHGFGRSAAAWGSLNDLWRFDGANWVWVSGSDVVSQKGVYGTKGVTETTTVPGGRYRAAGWIDSSGSLWLFGGEGLDTNGTFGALNDLWRFDGADWTWMGGGDVNGQTGVYGTKGIAAAGNVPDARYWAASWATGGGGLWLFGGYGFHSATEGGYKHNDLWRFNP